jgi:CCR4-NOT transcription complex subunit 1
LFIDGFRHFPNIFGWLINFACVLQTAYNLLQYEVTFSVFPDIVKNAMNSGMILNLWHVKPNLVLRGFIDALNSDPDSMTRILEICQELKVNFE